MKASELRIGNLLQGHAFSHPRLCIKSNGITAITGYGINIMEENPELLDHYSPIPLTLEILEAAGFVTFKTNREATLEVYNNLEGESLYITTPDKTEQNIFLEISGRDNDYVPQFIEKYLPHIKFLHQLQNLYFALTGEELPITSLPVVTTGGIDN